MRLCGKCLAVLLLATPAMSRAASCTTQAQMPATDRDAIAAAGGRLAAAVLQQDYGTLQAALLPAEAAEWEGMRGAVEQAVPIVKGGQVQLRSLYLMDASTLVAPADTQFFCSGASGSMTVTVSMRALPPGRYALVLADAPGSALSAQMGFVLVWQAGWKLGGLTVRQGVFDGHDGVWYWTRAREQAGDNLPWSAWFSYEAARELLVPVDFLSSPNLEKLGSEQSQIKNSPAEAFPYTLTDGPRSWKVHAIRLDSSLHEPDLGIAYESTGVTDPAAMRTEALAVMSALGKAHPDLKQSFHGMWAYVVKDGKATPVIEMPMAQIP